MKLLQECNCNSSTIAGSTGSKTDRLKADRQADRQADRWADRRADRQADRQADRRADKETNM